MRARCSESAASSAFLRPRRAPRTCEPQLTGGAASRTVSTATAYRIARATDKQIEALEAAAASQIKLGSLLTAAAHYELAAREVVRATRAARTHVVYCSWRDF